MTSPLSPVFDLPLLSSPSTPSYPHVSRSCVHFHSLSFMLCHFTLVPFPCLGPSLASSLSRGVGQSGPASYSRLSLRRTHCSEERAVRHTQSGSERGGRHVVLTRTEARTGRQTGQWAEGGGTDGLRKGLGHTAGSSVLIVCGCLCASCCTSSW